MLPVGISFYTFQTIAYVIDVYRGKVPTEKHFGKYAAFISFFPQLVAGPIERTRNLLPQIKDPHTFSYDKASNGIKLIACGYFKKLVIADNMAIYVDQIYNNLESYNSVPFYLQQSVLHFKFMAISPDIPTLPLAQQSSVKKIVFHI